MKVLKLTSYAKLNLYLRVLGKRPDNYHSIFTLFEKISLSDQIKLRLLPQKEICIVGSGFSIPSGSNNLAYRAARLLQREFHVNKGVEISIRKRIPVAAGLGGGSSNAAVVLAGLNQLWQLKLRVSQLIKLARLIGSDVSFFLHNYSFSSATSRGDEIKLLEIPVKLWHIIVVPRKKIFSSLVYKKWDELVDSTSPEGERAGLTNPQSAIKIIKVALSKKDFLRLSKLLYNSLEKAATAMYPVIGRVKLALSELGLEAISMSGSGSAVFGLVSSRKEAYAIERQLRKLGNWDVFIARTI